MEELEIPSEPLTPEAEPAGAEAQPPEAAVEIDVPVPDAPVSMEELLGSEPGAESAPQPMAIEDAQLMAVLEAIIYVTEEPLTVAQIAAATGESAARIRDLLDRLVAEFDKPEHGLTVREVAGGFKMATKPEHHDAVRNFVKSLKPPLKLSLPALETLAVIAYKQPVTAPEIMEIRGVQGAGVLKTLLDRKLIAVAGRKNVIGKPILYKTTKEFLIQFGLKDLSELPSLKEFEELRRLAFSDSEPAAPESPAPPAEAEAAEAVPMAGDAPAEPDAVEDTAEQTVEETPAESPVQASPDDGQQEA